MNTEARYMKCDQYGEGGPTMEQHQERQFLINIKKCNLFKKIRLSLDCGHNFATIIINVHIRSKQGKIYAVREEKYQQKETSPEFSLDSAASDISDMSIRVSRKTGKVLTFTFISFAGGHRAPGAFFFEIMLKFCSNGDTW